MEIHGEWRLKTVRNVVVTTLSGSWNEEASVAYFAEFRAAAEPLGRFCTLARYDAWGGYTPEAAAEAFALRRWAYEHGCACAAWVIEEPMMRKWIEIYLRNSEKLHETRCFAGMPEAVAWLAERGFSIDLTETDAAAA